MNLSQLLEDLQAFEKAVREEDIPEITVYTMAD